MAEPAPHPSGRRGESVGCAEWPPSSGLPQPLCPQDVFPVLSGPLSPVELASWALLFCSGRSQEEAASVCSLAHTPLCPEEAGPGLRNLNGLLAQLLTLLREVDLSVLELVGDTIRAAGLKRPLGQRPRPRARAGRVHRAQARGVDLGPHLPLPFTGRVDPP